MGRRWKRKGRPKWDGPRELVQLWNSGSVQQDCRACLDSSKRLLHEISNTSDSNRLTWFLTRHWITSFQLLNDMA